MKDCDFSGGGIASPMLVLLAGYVAGLERCCCGGHGGVVRSEGPEPGGSKGSYPGPIVSPRPDAINGAVWHDLNSNWQNDDGTGAYMGVSPRGVQVTLVGPIGEQSPQQQMLTNSDGVYEFANLVPGFYKLLVQRDATGVQGAAVTLVLGSEETNILHQPNQYHRQDFAYR
jgi:hypothetical protein